MNIQALSVDELVQLLAASGAKTASRSSVEAVLAAGAPKNADGTINLLKFAAFMVQNG